MNKIKFFFAICFVCFSCNKHKDEDSTIKSSEVEIEDFARVKFTTNFDDCNAYMIVIERETHDIYYKPDILANDYKIDNLHVKVKYIITEEKHNCGFGGYRPIIHIVEIEKR